jgi:hypothetical protein
MENGKFIAMIYVLSMTTALISTVETTDNFKANAVEQSALTGSDHKAPAFHKNAANEMQAKVD